MKIEFQDFEQKPIEYGKLEWRFETDRFPGIWQITPWLVVSAPIKDSITGSGNHWDFGIGWFQWGVTFSIGRWPREEADATKERT